jgi:hypothetical protein
LKLGEYLFIFEIFSGKNSKPKLKRKRPKRWPAKKVAKEFNGIEIEGNGNGAETEEEDEEEEEDTIYEKKEEGKERKKKRMNAGGNYSANVPLPLEKGPTSRKII